MLIIHLILVTHHIEEIMPVFSHALVLKSGRMIAAGEKISVLTSARLSQAFDAKVQVSKKQNRFEAKIKSNNRNVF